MWHEIKKKNKLISNMFSQIVIEVQINEKNMVIDQ